MNSVLLKHLNDQSFRNLVLFYRDKLTELHRTGRVYDVFTPFKAQSLRRKGVIKAVFWKGDRFYRTVLCEKTMKILKLGE